MSKVPGGAVSVTAQAPPARDASTASLVDEVDGAPLQTECLVVLRSNAPLTAAEVHDRVEQRLQRLMHHSSVYWALTRLCERRLARRDYSVPRKTRFTAVMT